MSEHIPLDQGPNPENYSVDISNMEIQDITEWIEKTKNLVGQEIDGLVFASEAVPLQEELQDAIDLYYQEAGKQDVTDEALSTLLGNVRDHAEALNVVLQTKIAEATAAMQERTGLQ